MTENFYTDKQQVRRAFDRAAARYDQAAVLQREVADRLFEHLLPVRLSPARILDAGCGTGYAIPLLRKQYPRAAMLELDLALGMLHAAARRASRLARLFGRHNPQICADIEALPLADGTVDLVWSSLAVQWLNEPDSAFREFHRVLRPEGLLMFSTFGPDTLLELRQAFGVMDDLPHVNHFIDMHDLGDALVRNGFSAPVMSMERIVLTYASVQDVMRDLKAIGANNVAVGRRRGLMGKDAFASVMRRYEDFRQDGRLPATYEVIYGHAWKPLPKVPGAAQPIRFHPRRGSE